MKKFGYSTKFDKGYADQINPRYFGMVEMVQLDEKSGTSSPSFLDENPYRKNSHSDNPFFDFIIGVILIIAAFPCIWMNERREVRFFKLIKLAEQSCKEIQDPKEVDFSLDKELVRVHGVITSSERVEDPSIPEIGKRNCLKLKRHVKVYRKFEKKTKD